jgi:hypothetical protein
MRLGPLGVRRLLVKGQLPATLVVPDVGTRERRRVVVMAAAAAKEIGEQSHIGPELPHRLTVWSKMQNR